MKLGNLLFSFLFFLILIFGSLFFYSLNYLEDGYFNQEVKNNLESLTNIRAERINNYFDERKEDLIFISESDKIKSLFKQNTVINESFAINDVNYHSKIIFKEVENFLKFHPKITLKELQENNEFKNLAVQSLGNQGYSAIAGNNNLILFHKYDSFIGKTIFSLGNPEALNLVNFARITGESQGFFNWTDPDNITRKKYGKLIRIPSEIFNESILIIVVTTYVEDYKELSNINLETQNYLTDLKNSYDFYNLNLISPNGDIIYCNKQIVDHNGENLLWNENLEDGDSNHFKIVQKDLKPSVFGPFITSYGDIYPKISLMNPVYDENKNLLGFIDLTYDLQKIWGITEEKSGLGETGEIYLVDSEGLLISKLKNNDYNLLIQSIESENTDRCFEMDNLGHMKHFPVDIFLNYNGEAVLGAHSEFSDPKWCLLAEIETQEVFDIPKAEKEFKNNIFLFLLIISLIIQIYFNKFIILRKKNLISGYSLIDNLFLKLKDFFIKFKLLHSILFALIFAIFYFFVSTLFFNGWQNAKFYDDIPDLLVIIVSFMTLIYSFRIDKFKPRNFIQFGSLFILLQRLLEIPLQEYQAIAGTLSLFIWIPVIFLGYLGILFILLGFKEVVK